MAITRVGATTDYTSAISTTPISVAWPAGHASGDEAVLVVQKFDNVANVNMVSTGWTQDGNISSSALGNDRAWGVWRRRATSGSEPVVEVDSTQDTLAGAVMWVARGVDATDPDDGLTRAGRIVANTVNPTPQVITTNTDNCAIVVVQMGCSEGSGAGSDDIDVAGAPSGYTLDTDGTDIGNAGMEWVVGYLLDAGAAGLKEPGAFTNTGSNQLDNSVFTIPFKPAAVTAGGIIKPALSATRQHLLTR